MRMLFAFDCAARLCAHCVSQLIGRDEKAYCIDMYVGVIDRQGLTLFGTCGYRITVDWQNGPLCMILSLLFIYIVLDVG